MLASRQRNSNLTMIVWTNCVVLIFDLLSVSASNEKYYERTSTEFFYESYDDHFIKDNKSIATIKEMYPTLRPIVNCTPPIIEQYPRSIISVALQGNNIALILIHTLIALYAFASMIVICINHFLPTIKSIHKELKYSPSFIGATFMAIGSSIPEFSKNIIGVFIAKDDIGVSGVFPSTIYNVPYVLIIGICSFFSKEDQRINCWTFCRDSLFYIICILGLFYTVLESIEWWKCVILLSIYLVYCVILCIDRILKKWLNSLLLLINCRKKSEPSAIELSTIRSFDEDDILTKPTDNQSCTIRDEYNENIPQNVSSNQNTTHANKSIIIQILLLLFPVSFFWQLIARWCKRKNIPDYYILSYFISLIFLFVFSYIMNWALIIIGNALKVPDTVLNFTVVITSLSILSTINSVVSIKNGLVAMAMSNAIGSNIFTVCISLGLPWLLQTALMKPGSHISVYSERLPYFVLSTLVAMMLLMLAMCLNKMKINSNIGRTLMGLFIIYNTLVYILNIFRRDIQIQCFSNF